MKHILYITLVCSCVFANVNKKFADPNTCAACHAEQFKDWQSTWHSHAHEEKNELFKKVVSYVKAKSFETRASVLTHCAKCHSPKLEITKVSDEYLYAKAFNVETSVTKKVDKALNASHNKKGISCFICHNIDKIDDKKSPKSGGLDIVHWTKGELIVGPFESSKRPGFHKTAKREHFIKGDKLCLACHQGSGNYNKLDGYQTGEEVATQTNTKRCVQCHMSSVKKDVIAPHMMLKDEPAVVRQIRSHKFAGARNSDILSNSIELNIKPMAEEVEFLIKNLTPHKVPTGFTGRSMVANFVFYNGTEVAEKQMLDFRVIHLDRMGKESISYVASKVGQDTRLKPKEIRSLVLQKPKGATEVKVEVFYYLVAPTLQELLGIKNDNVFSKKYKVASASRKL